MSDVQWGAPVSNAADLILSKGFLEMTWAPTEVSSGSAAHVKYNKHINNLARERGSIMAILLCYSYLKAWQLGS